MKKCPYCDGKGESFAFVNRGEDISTHSSGIFQCDQCKGSGSITDDHHKAFEVGRELRHTRVSAGISLMEEAHKRGISPAELSNIERGRIPAVLR